MAEAREDPKVSGSAKDLPRSLHVSGVASGSDSDEGDGDFVQPKPAHSGRSSSPRPRTRSAARALASSDPADPEEPAPMDLSKRPSHTDDEETSDSQIPEPTSSVPGNPGPSPLSQAKLKKRLKRRSKGCYEPKKPPKKKSRASEDPDWDAVEAFSGRMSDFDNLNDATKTAVVKTYCCASRSTDGKICVRKKECSQHSQEQRAEARATLLEGVVSRAKAAQKPRPSG